MRIYFKGQQARGCEVRLVCVFCVCFQGHEESRVSLRMIPRKYESGGDAVTRREAQKSGKGCQRQHPRRNIAPMKCTLQIDIPLDAFPPPPPPSVTRGEKRFFCPRRVNISREGYAKRPFILARNISQTSGLHLT